MRTQRTSKVSFLWERFKLHPTIYRPLLHRAYPISLGMLSFTLLSVVDTAMLGRLGAEPLAAAGISSVGYFAIVFSLTGIGVGVQTLTSRRYGEGKRVQCGEVMGAGLLLALIGGIPITVLGPGLARLISPILSSDLAIVHLGEVYLRYRFFGSAFFLLNWVYRGFYNGLGDTKKQLVYAVLMTGVNIILDYFLIFGHAGFPRMGIQGAAIASTIATAVGTVYLIAVSFRVRYLVGYQLYRNVTHFARWFGSILRLSVPVIGQRFLSETSFFIFFMIVSRIGTLELAATNVMLSIYHITIMPALGFAVAASTFVGQNLGAGDPEKAEQFAWEGAKLAAYLMGGLGLLFIIIPVPVFMIYTADPQVISVGRLPLMLLGLTQAFGGVAIVLSNSLQGAGNTRFVMVAELFICSMVYLPAAYLFGLRLGGGIVGAWTGEYVYWLFLAVVMSWKFRQGKWKTIRV